MKYKRLKPIFKRLTRLNIFFLNIALNNDNKMRNKICQLFHLRFQLFPCYSKAIRRQLGIHYLDSLLLERTIKYCGYFVRKRLIKILILFTKSIK